MSEARILVIEDEAPIRRFLKIAVESAGFAMLEADRGRLGIERAATEAPDLVVLDLGLPDMDGKAVVAAIREWSQMPILVLSVRDSELEKIAALDAGADDYVTKPFDMRELLARIHAVLRRTASTETAPPPASTASPTRFVFAGWQLDTVARGLTNAQGQDVTLTGGEFDLLCIFVQSPGKVLSRDLLLAQTRRRDAAPFDRTIDVQVGRLRKKLEADAQDPRIIKSVRGAGYILVPPVSGG